MAGRVIEETDFDGRTLRYEHDAAGQLVRSFNGLGEVTDYVFDALGNLVEWRALSGVTTYTYSPVGYLTHATNDDAIMELVRDVEGRILAETTNLSTVVFDYDDANNAVWRRTPSEVDSVSTYDTSGKPIGLTMGGHSMRFTADSGGRVVSSSIDDAATVEEKYDSEQRLVSQAVTETPSRPSWPGPSSTVPMAN